MAKRFLAFDLGAESGRAIVGTLAGGRLETDVIHRFPTRGVTILGRRQWDITRIFGEIVEGIRLAVGKHGPDFAGLGIDTWGVDFGLIARDGTLLGNPVHYRDKRTGGVAEAVYQRVAHSEIYQRTGTFSLPFNTIYQLAAMKQESGVVLAAADRLLFIGPLLGYWLTGRVTCEYTIASTAQMLRAGTMEWDTELLERLGLPTTILPKVDPAGTIVGTITEDVCRETGLSTSTPYISTAIHDTAAAVAAVPVSGTGDDWAYLSSGTWSLLGAELDRPLPSEEVRRAGFTNEGGVNGTIRFLRNIIGLWVVQECRRVWLAESGGREDGLDYGTLAREAGEAEPFRSLIDVEDGRLLAPDNMPETIRALCREQGQPVPESRAQVLRCAFESLALCYRRVLRRMDALLGRRTRRLHIIGGGTRNQLLCRMTADACGIPVQAGPVEATAIGNLLVQAMASGDLSSLEEARKVTAAAADLETYEPRDAAAWDEAEARLGPG